MPSTSLVRQLRGAGAIFRSSRGLVLLGVLVAVTIGDIAAFMIWHGRQSALKDHQRGMDSMGVVLAEQTSRYVQVIDLILQEVQARITHLDPASPADFEHQFATQDVHSYLAERLKHIPQADAIVLIDANGRIFNTSRASQARNPDVSDRDYYRYFLEHDDREAFVGSVSKSRGTGELSFFVARRINGSNGQFLGLVLGVVDLKYLTTFYQAAIEKLGETVALCRRDGTMLIRYPDPELAIGMKLAPGLPWHRHVAHGGGYYINTAAITGLPSLISVHLLRDYPLVLTLIMTEADALARWHKEALYTAGISIIAALTVAGLFWMLARQFRRQAEHNAELELGRKQVDAVLSNVTHGVCFFDGNKKLRLSNRRYAEIFNLPPEATQVGRSLEELIRFREAAGTAVDMSRPDYLSWRDNLMLTDKPPNAVTALRNGRFVASCYQAMPDGGWVATHEDVTERQHAEASLVFMARHDSLTKLPNRMLFKERMEQAIATARRGTGFAVLCLDLDKFKQVNDTMGHPVGDGLLIAVADRLAACVRDIDTVARLGGDEFAIIQAALQQREDADVLASRIIAAFSQPFDIDDHQITAGVSIGIAVAPDDGIFYDTLMRDADIALYLAKTQGRGTARFFEPEMDERIHLRRVLEQDLQSAIKHKEFELYYQPQVSLRANKITGFEALIRWHHPVRGFIPPIDFIPLAEETAMIIAIGEWVLQTACFEAENWPDDINVAVNLSPVQFKRRDLVETVQTALVASGLRPERLELEITESVFLGATTDTLQTLSELRAMGISVALDDFGTGYSSLSYLHNFPINKIKIDQSFVRDLMTSKESMSIVGAVTGIGQSLGMKTIAEGVETREQLDQLREKKCTEVQGFFFSRPRPASEVPAMIESVRTWGSETDLT